MCIYHQQRIFSMKCFCTYIVEIIPFQKNNQANKIKRIQKNYCFSPPQKFFICFRANQIASKWFFENELCSLSNYFIGLFQKYQINKKRPFWEEGEKFRRWKNAQDKKGYKLIVISVFLVSGSGVGGHL